jgi:hypothetical protein
MPIGGNLCVGFLAFYYYQARVDRRKSDAVRLTLKEIGYADF